MGYAVSRTRECVCGEDRFNERTAVRHFVHRLIKKNAASNREGNKERAL